MTPAVRALSRGAWLERINQGWRFRRGKVGLWPVARQVGVAALFLWRLAPSPTPVSLLVPATAVAALGAVGAFVAGLLLGREQLYGRSVLRVLHVSPASRLAHLAPAYPRDYG